MQLSEVTFPHRGGPKAGKCIVQQFALPQVEMRSKILECDLRLGAKW